jgi:beta-galactosidase
MNLGVQYYRAPFPNDQYWEADFDRIVDAGMNCVQLWVLWAWVEPKPGHFLFDDYDRLVALAEKKGLGVVLSTIAEIQPHWIFREVPGCEMIDHTGRKVVSSQRLECHFGLTPGGNTDHPGVWERMSGFLSEVVGRYKSSPALRGWDAWNELRWNVQADGFVSYDEWTLGKFRKWLDAKYGGLDGLNRAWQRRYGTWEEVMPGIAPIRPFTEMMAFQHFITWRANEHGRMRADLMRRLDANHPVTVHPASPCVLTVGGIESGIPWLKTWDQAINRGNDWFYADDLEGIGCSSFPKWANEDDVDFAVRLRFMSSAARTKRMWLSELQGSAAATENMAHKPVTARDQQRWLWNGFAAGADTVLFWCWRDEVFGREAGGFGISGNDGYATQRLEAMAKTGAIAERNRNLLEDFRVDPTEVGVFFSPQSYYLTWCQEGKANTSMQSIRAYCRSLNRRQIPYTVIEEEHLDELKGIRVLFMPRVNVLDAKTEKALEEFLNRGGVLFTESECGAFDSVGIWRYPEDRFTARMTGVRELGRRQLPDDGLVLDLDDGRIEVNAAQWLTPLDASKGKVLCTFNDPTGPASLLTHAAAGAGSIYLCGTFLGNSDTSDASMDQLIDHVVRRASVVPPLDVLDPAPQSGRRVQVSIGQSDGRRMIFLFAPEGTENIQFRLKDDHLASANMHELIQNKPVPFTKEDGWLWATVGVNEWGIAVLAEG